MGLTVKLAFLNCISSMNRAHWYTDAAGAQTGQHPTAVEGFQSWKEGGCSSLDKNEKKFKLNEGHAHPV